MKKKIAVIGIDGFLGTYLEKTYNPEKYLLQGTCYKKDRIKRELDLPVDFLDITDKKEVFRVLDKMNPDIVIHAAGNSNTEVSEKDPSRCYKSTVGGTWNIADWCNTKHKQLIYCSTNAIFYGDKAHYHEKSLPYPVNRYGMHKYIAENIAATVNSHLIFRLILMYGWNYETRINPVTFVINALREGKRINMVEKSSYVNSLFIRSCCDGIWQGIDLEKDREIYHLAGKDTYDRYGLAMAVADVFDLDQSLISPVSEDYFSTLAKRPFDSSFDTTKAEEELGFIPLALKEGLAVMKEEENK